MPVIFLYIKNNIYGEILYGVTKFCEKGIWKFIVSKLSNNLAINIFSSGKKDGLNRKDELYNKLIDKFKSDHLDFPKFTCSTEGSYFVQVLKYS